MSDDELQSRTCRCCDRGYKYPVPKSPATRFYCERCAALDAGVRQTLEHFNKRIRRLSSQVESFKGGAGPGAGES
ncbi:MAG: hypothetical protein ACYSUI_09190 [Planctomycetota bacterium]|jgi:hypothetical protein